MNNALLRISSWRKWKWDCSLTVFAGILSVMCAVKVGGAKNDVYFRSLVIGSAGYDVMRICGWSIVLLAIALIYTGGRYMTYQLHISKNNYIGVLLFLMLSHFLTALIMTEYKNTTISTLRNSLHEQLEASKMAESRFGVIYHLSELWDLLHVNMRCCGVDSYKDYGSNPDFLPQSCCVLKERSVIPQPENLAQCHHDVKLGVHSSVFLHTKGCYQSLLTWFMHYTSTVSGLLFASISLQVLSILYMLWKNLAPSQNGIKVNVR